MSRALLLAFAAGVIVLAIAAERVVFRAALAPFQIAEKADAS